MNLSHLSLVVFGLLSLLDVWTTERALKKTNTRELNPLIRELQKRGGVWISIKMFVAALIILALRDQTQLYNIISIWTLNAFYVAVVVNNYRFGKK